MMKRLFDFLGALILIIFLSPVLLVAYLLIKLSSPGSAIFTQERIGKHGKPFKFFKFRTMIHGAQTLSLGTVTIKDDPRIIKGGNFLRKYKLDELPQLFNVLNSTMSLVGPRPTVEEDFVRMNNEQKRRYNVKPGLTGLAQISGNTSLSWPRRIEYDLEYIQNQSIMLDIKIILRTALTVVTGQAETHPKGENEWEEM